MIENIPVSQIIPSLTNPRKYFDPQALAELVESVKLHGVLQPVLVRPLTGSQWFVDVMTIHGAKKKTTAYVVLDRNLIKDGAYKGKDLRFDTQEEAEANLPKYELVAGERRWRASKEAGLTEIPAVVRELNDKEALEVAVIENLQRSDLQPMEEAEGYELLMQKHGYTADDIAAKVGKSKAYVYGRLKLTALCPDARQWLAEGKLSPSLALLVARIPHAELQVDALSCCVDYDGEPATYKHAVRAIQQQYMLRLKEAPFSTKDAKLVLEAGSCSSCIKRTGNQSELFADVDSADVCTDPKCYAAKRKAHGQKVVDKAAAKGLMVLGPGDAFNQWGTLNRDYFKLTDYCSEVGMKWKDALGKFLPASMIAVDANGDTHEVYRRSEGIQALKELNKLPEEAPTPDRKAELREQRVQRLIDWKATQAILSEVVFSELPGVTPDLWRYLAWGAFQYTNITHHSETAKRRGLAKTQNEARPALEAWIADEARTPQELAGLVVELLCCASPWNEERWVDLCRFAGVDLAKLQAEAVAEVK